MRKGVVVAAVAAEVDTTSGAAACGAIPGPPSRGGMSASPGRRTPRCVQLPVRRSCQQTCDSHLVVYPQTADLSFGELGSVRLAFGEPEVLSGLGVQRLAFPVETFATWLDSQPDDVTAPLFLSGSVRVDLPGRPWLGPLMPQTVAMRGYGVAETLVLRSYWRSRAAAEQRMTCGSLLTWRARSSRRSAAPIPFGRSRFSSLFRCVAGWSCWSISAGVSASASACHS
jgi:hypothetical protein